MKEYPLLVIVGETASGKTELAIDLAKKFNGEIISADSVTIRKELNIGSSKPDKLIREQINHYLIDEIEPDEHFNVALFKQKTEEAITAISQKNKLAILVGGTGLYVDSVVYNFQFRDNSNKYDRDYLNSLSVKSLVNIAKKNNLNLRDVDSNNRRRLIRLIETGSVDKKDIEKIRDNTLIIGLNNSKEDLNHRIVKRVESMFELGLEQEVKNLYLKYGSNKDIFNYIGYKEWLPFFKNQTSVSEVKANIIKNTLYLAKKQRTWFKRNKSIRWFSYPLSKQDIVDLVTSFIAEEHFN